MKRRSRTEPPLENSRADAEAASDARRRALSFVFRFLAALAIGQFAIVYFTPIEGWAIHTTLASLQGVSALLGLPGEVAGNSFSVGAASVAIIGECTPL